jgi:hypothetical protein
MIMFKSEFSGDGLDISLLSLLPYIFPVLFVITLYGFDAELERAFQASVILHTVRMSPVVDLDHLKVRP